MNKIFALGFSGLVIFTAIYIYYVNETIVELATADAQKDAELNNLSDAYLDQVNAFKKLQKKEIEEREEFVQVMDDVMGN